MLAVQIIHLGTLLYKAVNIIFSLIHNILELEKALKVIRLIVTQRSHH